MIPCAVSRTEKEIQQALNEVSKNQTTLIIAHRLSTIVNADEIIVLADGEVTERGTHEDLMHKRGLYFAMWQRQSSGFAIGSSVSGALPSEASASPEVYI